MHILASYAAVIIRKGPDVDQKKAGHIGRHKRAVYLAPIFVLLDVICELSMPLFMSKIVDVGILRSLDAIRALEGDVVLLSHDADFIPASAVVELDIEPERRAISFRGIEAYGSAEELDEMFADRKPEPASLRR